MIAPSSVTPLPPVSPSMQTAFPDRLAAFVRDLCAQPVTICDHREYTVLRNIAGSPMADHEHVDAECDTCGEHVRVTIWYTRDEVDIRALVAQEVADLRTHLSIRAAEELADREDRYDD